MSYLRFAPDVRPPPAEEFRLPRRRWGLWIGAAVLYLALMAGWLWWMIAPPKIQPPLAIIPLPDGSELRLIHVARGAVLPMDSDDTFGGRVRLPPNRYRATGLKNDVPGTIWLVFTRFEPWSEKFSPPGIVEFCVREEAHAFSLPAKLRSQLTSDAPFKILSLDVAPARATVWPVQINWRGQVFRASLPNPFPAKEIFPLIPRALPQEVHFRGDELVSSPNGAFPLGAPAKITLQRVDVHYYPPTARRGSTAVIPGIQITYGDLREDDFTITEVS